MTILSIGGHEFYAEILLPAEKIPSARGVRNAAVFLWVRGNEHVSSTGLKWLSRYARALQEGGNLLMLADAQPIAVEQLTRTGVMDLIGEENVLAAEPGIGTALDSALDAARAWLAGNHTEQG